MKTHRSISAWEAWRPGGKAYHVDRFSADVQDFNEALEVLDTRRRIGLSIGFNTPVNFIKIDGELFQRLEGGAWSRVDEQ